MRGEVVLYDYSAFHDEFDVLKFGDVCEWIARDSNEVRVFACFDRSYPGLLAH